MEEVEEEVVPTPIVFAARDVKAITEYLTQTVFSHFQLYRAAFGKTFSPGAETFSYTLRVDTPIQPTDEGTQLNTSEEFMAKLAEEEAIAKKQKEEADAAAAAAAAEASSSSEAGGNGENGTGSAPSKEEGDVDQAVVDTHVDADTQKFIEQKLANARKDFERQLDSNRAELEARLQALK